MCRCPVRYWCAPVVVWSFGLAAAFASPTAFADQLYPSVVSRSDREKQIVAKLDEDVDGFEFFETALEEFVVAIADIHGIQIVLDRLALKAGGLDSTIPVTSHLSRVSLRSALRQTLAPLGLTYAVRDEVLLITTPDSPNAFEVRCYNVRQLLRDDQSTDELTGSLSRILNTPTLTNMEGFQGPEEAYGGGSGPRGMNGRCIATFGNVMIVRDTACGHEQVGRVLATLRDVLGEEKSVAHTDARLDRPATRPTIRRVDPQVRRPRRGGEATKNNRVDDPFAEPTDRKTSVDPFGNPDEFGGSTDDPFGDFKESNGPRADDPFGE